MAHTIESLLAMLPGAFKAANVKGADTVLQLDVTGAQAGNWNVVIKDGNLTVTKGAHPAPKLTVTAEAADFLAVANGQLDPIAALMQGKVKTEGDLSEAMRLFQLLKPK